MLLYSLEHQLGKIIWANLVKNELLLSPYILQQTLDNANVFFISNYILIYGYGNLNRPKLCARL